MYYKLSLILLSFICLVGCTMHHDIEHLDEDVKIRIGYPIEENFNKRYKNNVINQKFSNLNYTVVSLNDLINEDIESEQIVKSTDIIFVPREKMSEYINSGLLKNLDPLIKKSSLDLSLFHPEIVEYSRDLGGGSIYGVPTSVYGSVLAYNKDLFDAYQIDYPHDGMTWEEVLYTAQLFPQDGLVLNVFQALEVIYDIGNYRGLQAYNSDFNIVNIDNEHWADIWNEVITPLKSNAISLDINDFFMNNAAMAVINDNRFHHIDENDNFEAVTMPINPNTPTESKYIYTDGFYAISENTSYVRESFELLQFFLSPQLSKLEKARSQHYLSIYKNDPPLKSERALLNLRPLSEPINYLPFEFYSMGEATIKQLMDSDLSIKTALSSLQLDLEDALGGINEE